MTQSPENDAHTLTMEVQDAPRMFRAVCSCGGYVGAWETTNACMGRGRRHVAAMRRRARVTPPASCPPGECGPWLSTMTHQACVDCGRPRPIPSAEKGGA